MDLKDLLFVLATFALSVQGYDWNFQNHLDHLNTPRHPVVAGGANWRQAKEYVSRQFSSYGLEVLWNNFSTPNTDGYKLYNGSNIVGLAKGTDEDHVLVIGTDLDTDSEPEEQETLKQDGAALAILLELARNFMDLIRDPKIELEKTVMFVAFDINSLEFNYHGSIKPGSLFFANYFLKPYLKDVYDNFDGAIIMNSLSTFSDERDSQRFPVGFQELFPSAYHQSMAEGFKGNFLGMMIRDTDKGEELWESFSGHYNKDRKARKYRLQELKLESGKEVSGPFIDILEKSDVKQFWEAHFPAALLTDTGIYRNDPCHADCSHANFLTKERQEFMTSTSEALLNLLHQRQTSDTALDFDEPENGGLTKAFPNFGLLTGAILCFFIK